MSKQDAQQSSLWDQIVLCVLAVGQGGLFYSLIEQKVLGQLGTTDQIAVGLFVTVTLAVYMLLHKHGARLGDGLFSIIIGLATTAAYKGSIVYMGFVIPQGTRSPVEILLALAVIYAVLSIIPAPIYQAVRARAYGGFSTGSIFRNAAANLLALAVALFVVALGWLLLAIWAVSFMASGEKYFVELFQQPSWIWPFTITILAVSVAMTREWLTRTHFSIVVRLLGAPAFASFLGAVLLGGILMLGVGT